jgi:hypothetical protein
MNTPISRKLCRVDDTTSDEDLTTEISTLIKNTPGSLPRKLHRVLIDTGCSKTFIKKNTFQAS